MINKPLILTAFAFCLVLCGSAFGGKCTSDDTSIIATFAGVTRQPPYSITSDGGGPYNNVSSRSNTMQVMFQICNGSNDFIMDLSGSYRKVDVFLPSGLTSSSSINFDRIADVPVTEDSTRFADFCGGRNMDGTIILGASNTATADNYGGCGLDGGGYYVKRSVSFQLPSGMSLWFQNSPYDGGTLASATSYVKVYHPTVNTWTMMVDETPLPCGAMGRCGAMLYKPNGGQPQTFKYYTLGQFQVSLSSAKAYF